MSYSPIFKNGAITASIFRINDLADDTKKLAFDVSAIGTGITRTITMPNVDVNLGNFLLKTGDTMSGILNMGGQAITNVGLVDGVTVNAHAARHQPGGADAISTAAPASQTADAANAAGISTSLARADHIHNISTAIAVTIGTANSQGSSSSFSKSNHIHDHGPQSTATHHTIATTGANGFMSSTDKSKLDGISGTLKIKAGTVVAGTFTGNPKKATVTFGTAFASANYAITFGGAEVRTITWESKVAGSFVINLNANAAPAANIDWYAVPYGEFTE